MPSPFLMHIDCQQDRKVQNQLSCVFNTSGINNWLSKTHKLAGKQIRILDDLPVSMKEERFLLSHVAYKIRKNEKLQTGFRDDGAHLMLETRKGISDKWSLRE
jgi:hypothetical protein